MQGEGAEEHEGGENGADGDDARAGDRVHSGRTRGAGAVTGQPGRPIGHEVFYLPPYEPPPRHSPNIDACQCRASTQSVSGFIVVCPITTVNARSLTPA